MSLKLTFYVKRLEKPHKPGEHPSLRSFRADAQGLSWGEGGNPEELVFTQTPFDVRSFPKLTGTYSVPRTVLGIKETSVKKTNQDRSATGKLREASNRTGSQDTWLLPITLLYELRV